MGEGGNENGKREEVRFEIRRKRVCELSFECASLVFLGRKAQDTGRRERLNLKD